MIQVDDMSMDKLRAILRKCHYSVYLALLDSAIGMLLFGWPIPVTLAVAIGIAGGYLLAEKLFHRAGVDVEFIPILLASTLAIGTATAFGEDPMTLKVAMVLGGQVLLSFFLGELVVVFIGMRLSR